MLDIAAQFLLAPILAVQGLKVRSKALKLPEAAGSRNGGAGTGRPLSLVIIGDSSAAGVGADHQRAALSGQLENALAPNFKMLWQLLAKTGATTASTLKMLERQSVGKADIVVTALGVNDVTSPLSCRRWQRQQKQLLGKISTLYDPDLIYLSGLPPMGYFPLLPDPLRWILGKRADRFDNALAKLVAGYSGAVHVPFRLTPNPTLIAQDGFHPNGKAYTIWANEMASRIIADWPKNNV